MATIALTQTIEASPSKVFAVLTQPHTIGALVPGVIKVSDVPDTLKRGSIFGWEYVLLGMRFHGSWIIDELQAPSVYIAKTTGGITSQWSYLLKDLGEKTNLSFELQYEIPSSLMRGFTVMLIEPHARKMAETYLQSLQHYVELGRA